MPPKSSSRSSSPATSDVVMDTKEINNKLDLILVNQTHMLNSLNENKEKIHKLEADNQKLNVEVGRLNEDVTRLEQYSRKGVMVVTGVTKSPDETSEQLRTRIVGMFNSLLFDSNEHLSVNDFVDIHRNSKEGKLGRPPSITVKFIRYTDKNLFFNRRIANTRKSKHPGVNFFHNLCKPLIAEQNLIKDTKHVKFVRYDGDNRHFTVCLTYDNDSSFLNYIKNYTHFKTEYDKWYNDLDV